MAKKGFEFEGEKFSIADSTVLEGWKRAYSNDGATVYSNYYGQMNSWEPSMDLTGMPKLSSGDHLLDALYKMALQEVRQNVQEGDTFAAGEFWTGRVWTRDAAYSILLSLALLMPSESINSLKAKLDGKRIIQDTGTGGAYPVSTDRVVWIPAAWEIYKVTGDEEYLGEVYEITKANLDQDMHVALDPDTGLFRGETSFLDWREQSYPYWFTWEKIYESRSLSTNACFYKALEAAAMIGEALKKPADEYHFYKQQSARLKGVINKLLWMEDRGYYSIYRYPSPADVQSDKSDALGEALAVLFGIADRERSEKVIASTPVVDYGVPCFFPQQPLGESYHNKAIWPFVQSFFTWAAAQVRNEDAVVRGIASLIRQAALFLTNKENFEYNTGRPDGTALNSNRQLWSAAGFLAIVYRVLFGITLEKDGLRFSPFVPKGQFGEIKLSNLKYRNALLTVRVIGQGSEVASILVNGVDRGVSFIIPEDAQGEYYVDLYMKNGKVNRGENLCRFNMVSPKTPEWIEIKSVEDGKLMLGWQPIRSARYDIYRDGRYLAGSQQSTYCDQLENPDREFHSYCVVAIGQDGNISNFSPWVLYSPWQEIHEAETAGLSPNLRKNCDIPGFTGQGYVDNFHEKGDFVEFTVEIPCQDCYRIDFRYSNANGGSDSSYCCIRSLYVNGRDAGTVVMGANSGDWWYSSHVTASLRKGKNSIRLQFDLGDENMGGYNEAKVDHMRLIRLYRYYH